MKGITMKKIKQLLLCSLICIFFVGEVQLSGGPTQVDSEKHQCVICCCREHEENGTIPRATGCGHLFHENCLRKWFEQDPEQKCPICKRVLDEHFDIVDKPDLPGFQVTRFDDEPVPVMSHAPVSLETEPETDDVEEISPERFYRTEVRNFGLRDESDAQRTQDRTPNVGQEDVAAAVAGLAAATVVFVYKSGVLGWMGSKFTCGVKKVFSGVKNFFTSKKRETES